jgi:hypothetical protein
LGEHAVIGLKTVACLPVEQSSSLEQGPQRRLLPRRYRYLLPMAGRIVGDVAAVTLFRSRSR